MLLPTLTISKQSTRFEPRSKRMAIKQSLSRLTQTCPTRFEMKNLISASTSPKGLGGDAREAQIPALLEMLQIPYTGSRVLANGISLDKTLTKRIWRDRRLPVAPFQEFIIGDEPLRPDLEFPLFVKPAREGTGMGVDMNAIVNNEKELRERARIHHQYLPAACACGNLSAGT